MTIEGARCERNVIDLEAGSSVAASTSMTTEILFGTNPVVVSVSMDNQAGKGKGKEVQGGQMDAARMENKVLGVFQIPSLDVNIKHK